MKRGALYFLITVVVIVVIVVLSHFLRAARFQRDLTEDESQAIAVTTIHLEVSSAIDSIRVTGSIHGIHEAGVSAETSGRVIALYGEVGDFFEAGRAILQLDSTLKSLTAQQAKIAFEKAEADFERAQNLYKARSISDTELEGARLAAKGAEVVWRMAEKDFLNTTIRAPFAGTLTRRFVELGEMVAPGAPVVDLVDLRRVKAKFELTERELVATAEGDSVQAGVDALPELVLHGTITARSPQATKGTRTFSVEATFPGVPGIASGMFLRGFIMVEGKGKGFLVPREALYGSGEETHVFIAENGIAHARNVHSENPRGAWVVVHGDELKSGQALIITAAKTIQDGATISTTRETKP